MVGNSWGEYAQEIITVVQMTDAKDLNIGSSDRNDTYVVAAAAAAKSLQSCPTLCGPIDGSPPGSPIPGILQARTLEWVAISFSKLECESESEVAQSSLTLSDPMDCSLPRSSIHGIFQARVLEWGAIAFSRYLLQTHNCHGVE